MTAAFTLARWFTERPEANEWEREELLGDLYGNRVVAKRQDATKGEQIIVRTQRQTCVIERADYQGSPLITFDSVANDRWHRVGFWFNLHSVADLLDKLRNEATADFDTLFLGVKPG